MSKPTSAGSLAAYFKQNKFLMSFVIVGIVAVVAIAGVFAANNDNGGEKTDTPQVSQSSEEKDAKKDDSQSGDKKEVAVATDAVVEDSQAGEVLGESTADMSAQIPSTQTAVVPAVAAPTAGVTGDVNSGAPSSQTPGGAPQTPTDPVVPGNPGATPTNPGTNPTPAAAFNRALVSLTFDDGWKSIHANGLSLLQKYGLVSTQYVNAESIIGATTGGWTGYMTANDLKEFTVSGHEIAWHTNTHAYDLTAVDEATRIAELSPQADFLAMLTSVGVNLSRNYAAPYGTHSAEAAASAKANGFDSYRTTYDGYNVKGTTNFMNIKVKNVCGVAGVDACNGLATTPTQVAAWVAEAQANRAWLVIVFHEVGEFSRQTAQTGGTVCDADPAETPEAPDTCVVDPTYAITPANFDASLKNIKDSGVDVVTMQQAIDELKAQP